MGGIVLLLSTTSKAMLVNGDFETGDLSGWTPYHTSINGTIGTPAVVLFDTNKNGSTSNAARFNVGRVSGFGGNQGGGIKQSVSLEAGQYIFGALIAAVASQTVGNNDGGLFKMLLNGSQIDSHDFGFISTANVKSSLLQSTETLTAGVYELGIKML